jgi:hypothetical protein
MDSANNGELFHDGMTDDDFREAWIRAVIKSNLGRSHREIAEAAYRASVAQALEADSQYDELAADYDVLESEKAELADKVDRLENALAVQHKIVNDLKARNDQLNVKVLSLADRLAACSEVLGRIAEKKSGDKPKYSDVMDYLGKTYDTVPTKPVEPKTLQENLGLPMPTSGEKPQPAAASPKFTRGQKVVNKDRRDTKTYRFEHIIDCECSKPDCVARREPGQWALVVDCNGSTAHYANVNQLEIAK